MTDTPETDNLARGNHVVPTEFAQDLERKCNLYNSYFESTKAELKQVRRALGDARIEAHNWKKAFNALNPSSSAFPPLVTSHSSPVTSL
jgi:hypothetical protein